MVIVVTSCYVISTVKHFYGLKADQGAEWAESDPRLAEFVGTGQMSQFHMCPRYQFLSMQCARCGANGRRNCVIMVLLSC